MRILQLAPLIERVPPKKYGGIERVIYFLTEELVKRGHDVTLYATGDSITSAHLTSVYPRSLREIGRMDRYGPNVFSMLNIGLAYKNYEKFDIIHDHHNEISLPTANLSKIPVVMTLHAAFSPSSKQLFKNLNSPNFVAISKYQKDSFPALNIKATVYNGLKLDNCSFSREHDNYLIYVGRISPEKGVHY